MVQDPDFPATLYYLYRDDLNTGFWTRVAVYQPTADHPHFPYGWEVEPDQV